jgi:hypothetical protein
MTIPAGLFSALILVALTLVAAAPVILIVLWVLDWKRRTLW